MKLLLVSLVHNRRHLLGECVLSGVNQTLPTNQWIHLLIDNASTDGADVLAESFARKYPHVRFARMGSNLGQMPAYNWVLNTWVPNNLPDTDVLVQLDSDDVLTPFALEEVDKAFIDPRLIQTYSDFDIIDAQGRIKLHAHPKAKQVDPAIELTEAGQRLLRVYETNYNSIGHLRALRIPYLCEIGGFDETYRYATDVNMACRSLSSKYMVRKIPRVLYQWRDHGGQVQGEVSKEQTECWESIRRYYQQLWTKEGKL